MSASDHVVDLTMETSSDDALTADEVVVVTSRRSVTANSRNADSALARRASTLDLKPQPRNAVLSARSSRARSPPTASLSRKRTPDASPAGSLRSARPSDDTPSRGPRFSLRDEIRDSQSPSPSIKTTAHQQDPTPQPSNRPLRAQQMPTTQTPKRMGWTVDKIASTLTDLSEQVSHGHARLVDFLLEEADKKSQQPRHLSTVDTFASMPSIVIDTSTTPPPDLETMAVKFKASRTRAARSRRREC